MPTLSLLRPFSGPPTTPSPPPPPFLTLPAELRLLIYNFALLNDDQPVRISEKGIAQHPLLSISRALRDDAFLEVCSRVGIEYHSETCRLIPIFCGPPGVEAFEREGKIGRILVMRHPVRLFMAEFLKRSESVDVKWGRLKLKMEQTVVCKHADPRAFICDVCLCATKKWQDMWTDWLYPVQTEFEYNWVNEAPKTRFRFLEMKCMAGFR